ncbi:MAG: LLM class flavin-dependent oxidoreductase [Acidobacteria bacterium]|nr:LLM class flavin-dependent oxidoreductase [Acidobacteriota bacterium]
MTPRAGGGIARRPGLSGIELFSTCPASSDVPQDEYLRRVIDIARWSEAWGCTGILVYADNSLVDPWVVAHTIIRHTRSLSPLVAVQPIYMHPYAVAKIVSTLGYLYGRRVYLNMVAGGFKNDLAALNDSTPHDQRYTRLVEYTLIVKRLLGSPAPVTHLGEFYTIEKLKLAPSLRADLLPGIFVSGSSDAGMKAAHAIGATAIKYPKAPGQEVAVGDTSVACGVRLGIIARDDDDEAWKVAHARFPDDRRGQLTRQLALKVSDSTWHKTLGDTTAGDEKSPYWLGPFNSYKTMCPYLVGSHDEVVAAVSTYVRSGFRTFILDTTPDASELGAVAAVFSRVAALDR